MLDEEAARCCHERVKRVSTFAERVEGKLRKLKISGRELARRVIRAVMAVSRGAVPLAGAEHDVASRRSA
jgi:hypothetical protein